jgi:hypothetical protein
LLGQLVDAHASALRPLSEASSELLVYGDRAKDTARGAARSAAI